MIGNLPGLIVQPLPSGNNAYRVRVKGQPHVRIQIPQGLSDEEFLAAYYSARRGEKLSVPSAMEHLVSDPRFKATVRKMLNMARTRAKERGMAFSICHDDVVATLEKQGGVCALSKMTFDISQPEDGKRRMRTMSIDRVDSNGGYVSDNIRITSVMVNMARLNWSDGAFREMCSAVASA